MMPKKRLLALVPEAATYMVQKVIFSWLSLVGGIILWFSLGEQIQRVKEGKDLIPPLLILVLACILIRFVLARLIADRGQRAASCVKSRLRRDIYAKICRLGPSYADQFPTAELVQLAGDGVEQLESYFGNYVPQFFFAMLAPLTLLLVFWPLSPMTGLILFACVPLIPLAIAKVQRFAKRLLSKYWDAYAKLGDSFLENLQGLTTLKVYGADARRHEQMNEEAEHFRRVTMKVLTMQLNSVTIMDLVAYGGSAVGCILTALAYRSGSVNFGQSIAMVMLSAEFFLAMRALGSYFHTAMNGIAASDRIFRLLDLKERDWGEEAAENGDIRLENLSFSYDGKKEVLEEIRLLIPRGSMVSLVGESGCGKSTLAAILSGFRDGYQGELYFADKECRQVSAESIRSLVTVVGSAGCLFEGSVRDCLLEGKADASDREMLEALRKVSLLDFIESQGGLDFQLRPRGENLSGGQRQRLVLARALLKDSPIYIFDEATSNIDAESEEVIMKAVEKMRRDHTILLISHRLANVVGSDSIVYLEGGRIREMGTHSSLMEENGGYAGLYRAQEELEQYQKGKAMPRPEETRKEERLL